jgi:hypothetical protein
MKTLWILAAAATFAACHNRSEETGAAPERGDTTAVKGGYDTTAAPTPAPADTGMKADTGYKADTTSQTVPNQPPADTTNRTVPSDTTQAAPPQNPTYDTTSTTVPQNPTYDTTTANPPAPAPGGVSDTTMAPSGDTTMQHDTSSTSTTPDSSTQR